MLLDKQKKTVKNRWRSTLNIGLSICAYGWPESKFLSTVNSNAFLLRNAFDYITFCCGVQNTVITAMIIDYL